MLEFFPFQGNSSFLNHLGQFPVLNVRDRKRDLRISAWQRTDVTGPLSGRSWGGTRDEPKLVCVGGQAMSHDFSFLLYK